MKKLKQIIINNYKWITIYLITFIALTVPLPYYIEMPGGLIDVSKRIEIENSNEIEGSINLAYVSTTRANVVNAIIAYFIDDWSLIKKEEVVAPNETVKEADYRNHLSLEEANQTAILLAYKKANKQVNIEDSKVYVTYIHELAKTNLEVGDEIKSINGNDISTKQDITDVISDIDIGETIDIEVIKDEKHHIRTAEIVEYENNKILGIVLSQINDLNLEPEIEFHFKESESGSSGGLMMTLAVYNYLIDEDLTNGRVVAGTGTIETDGTVGAIDGVKYKLMGAVKEKASIFFVPEENYKEALEVKKDKNYDIEVVSVKTLDDAISYLKKTF